MSTPLLYPTNLLKKSFNLSILNNISLPREVVLFQINKAPETQGPLVDRDFSDNLALSIERAPNILTTSDGRNVNAVALMVRSRESRKIMELRAILEFEHLRYNPEKDNVSQAGFDLYSVLYWSGRDVPVKEIELRPDEPRILYLCELLDVKTTDGNNVKLALMTSDSVPISTFFSYESIYCLKIAFQGKLENEDIYRDLEYEEYLYTKPTDQLILFLDDAQKSYPNIPKKLLERGKPKFGI